MGLDRSDDANESDAPAVEPARATAARLVRAGLERVMPTALQRATPRLVSGVFVRSVDGTPPDGAGADARADAGAVAVEPRTGAACDLAPDEVAAIALIDGQRSVEALLRAALALTPPLRPAACIGMLRHLHACGLVTGLGPEAAAELSGDQRGESGGWRFVRRWHRWLRLGLTLPPPLRWPSALGLRASVAAPAAAVGVVATLALVAALVASGAAERTFDLFAAASLVERSVAIYLMAAVAASIRGLLRAALLAGAGEPARLWLGATAGLLHLDVDDRARAWLPLAQRVALYQAGVAGLALPAATGLAASWLVPQHPDLEPLRVLGVVACTLLLVDLAPYGRGDGWNLAGAWSRVPDLRRRAAAWMLRRSLRNLWSRTEAMSHVERTALLLASAWLAHGIATSWLLMDHLLPSVLRAVATLARVGDASMLRWAIAMTLAAGLLAIVLLLVVGLGVVFVGAATQLMRRREPRPVEARRVADVTDEILDAMSAVPFLAALPRDELTTVVAGTRRERWPAGGAIVHQGDAGDRFCLILDGSAWVEVEEETGLRARVATLRAGDFFGELALLEERPRTATVRAASDTTIVSLDRQSFVTLVEHSTFNGEAIAMQVRNASAVRAVEAFQHCDAGVLSTLLASLTVRNEAIGQTIVRQGDAGDSVFLVREGRVRIERREGGSDHTLDSLGPGDVFGEFTLLRGDPRSATAIVERDAVLLELPATCLDAAICADPRIGVTLHVAMERRRLAHGAA